jgi:cholesterol oxidase
MLSSPWDQRKSRYDIIVVGSGYGGAITAARLASADLNPKPSVCVLERGKEWQPGEFPESMAGVARTAHSDLNPLGLFELLTYPDLTVLQGSGVGGTSLINANVALVPDREVFEQSSWPQGITYDELRPYYDRARQVLGASPYPHALDLAKVRALDRRAKELGSAVQLVDIAVNFSISGDNQYGVRQAPCHGCGNCTTGCNTGAKNTLCMNYLPMARNAGAEILSQTNVEWI